MAFVSARNPSPKIVIYKDANGNETVREGGSRAWRNNNPGNIIKGSFAVAQGAIGADSRFAIFPDETTGKNAIVALLKSPSYRSLTLEKAINRYAPPSENNTAGYVDFVVNKTGVQKTDILSSLNSRQLQSIANAIKAIEGWKPGKEYANQAVAMLSEALSAPLSSAAVAANDWMQVALTEAALPANARSEWPDPGENPRILKYFQVAAPWFDAKAQGGDEVDWCAAFVNFCLETAGYTGTGHPGARSFYWNKGSHFIVMDKPVYGSIAIFRDSPFSDKDWKNGTGHVGFVVDWTDDKVELLGGNQGKTVKRQWYARQSGSGNAITRKVVGFAVPAMN